MKVIIEGLESEVKKVLKENSVRVSRGLIKFTPADEQETPEETAEPKIGDDTKGTKKGAKDSKTVKLEDTKEL